MQGQQEGDEEFHQIVSGQIEPVVEIKFNNFDTDQDLDWEYTFLNNIKILREAVRDRNPEVNTYYKMEFYPKTKISRKCSRVTGKKDYFIIGINNKSIYPPLIRESKGWIVYFNFEWSKWHKNQFEPTYSQKPNYCVQEICGILIAEQMRFNLLELMIQEQNRSESPLDRIYEPYSFFKRMWGHIEHYRNWKYYSQNPSKMPEGLELYLKWQK